MATLSLSSFPVKKERGPTPCCVFRRKSFLRALAVRVWKLTKTLPVNTASPVRRLKSRTLPSTLTRAKICAGLLGKQQKRIRHKYYESSEVTSAKSNNSKIKFRRSLQEMWKSQRQVIREREDRPTCLYGI